MFNILIHVLKLHLNWAEKDLFTPVSYKFTITPTNTMILKFGLDLLQIHILSDYDQCIICLLSHHLKYLFEITVSQLQSTVYQYLHVPLKRVIHVHA